MIQRLPRLLDRHEIRVLGCLLEKEQATPEYYPLTLNALVAACNQRSNRYPVLSLSDRQVGLALQRLVDDRLVKRDDGGRASRWRHGLDRRLSLDAAGKAALTVLLLRGPQTVGELRSRSARLHDFGAASEAETALADLAAPPDPLVVLLEREPGQKEPRWGHRLGIEETAEAAAATGAVSKAAGQAFDLDKVMLRLQRLEQQVQEIQSAMNNRPGLFD